MPISLDEFHKLPEKRLHNVIVDRMFEHYQNMHFKTYKKGKRKLGEFIADLISVRDQNLVVAIEAKTNNKSEIRKGVGQAFSYMDWVHKVYLAVPLQSISLTRSLLKNTPIGLYSVSHETVSLIKEATKVDPEYTKLTQLLGNTTGFCWICGRTFNIVPKTSIVAEERGWIPITHKNLEPRVFKALEKESGIKIETETAWVRVCTVCSRIIGSVIGEYVKRVLKREENPNFDFTDF